MAAARLPYMRGRDVSVFTLTPLTVTAPGVITAGGAVSLAGTWDQVSINLTAHLEDIHAADAVRANNMVIVDEGEVTITEILPRSGASKLGPLFAAGDDFLLSMTRGGNSWAIYLTREGYREEIKDGKSVAIASFKTFDPTVANPAFS